MPFYVQSFGASATTVTLLFAVFSLFALFSSPLLGALSDKIGRRPVLIISMISTTVGWVVFSLARSTWLLFLGRIIDGAAAGNFTTAQSALVDIAKDDRERTVNIGLIGATFGVGFVVGPLLGGFLGHFGPVVPFWFAAGLSAVNMLGAIFLFPETNKHLVENKSRPYALNPFAPLTSAVKDKILRAPYAAWFLFQAAMAIMQSVFALYLNAAFGYGPLTVGLFLGGMGVVLALNQGIALRKFWLHRFAEPSLELVMLAAGAVALTLLGIPFLSAFLLGLLLNTLSQSILRAVMTSQVVGAVTPSRRGEVLGVLSSIMFVANAVGPAFAGVIFEWHSFYPFAAAAMCMVVAWVVTFRNRRRLAQIIAVDDPEEILVG